MLESMFEFQFAEGRLPALPDGITTPPDWAINAAKWVGKHCIKAPSKEETKADPRGTIQHAIGMYEGVLAFLAQPLAHESEDEIAGEAIRKLHKFGSRVFTRTPLRAMRKLDARLDQLLPPVTPEQLLAHNSRRREGMEAIVDAAGELQVIKTKQAEVYYMVWFLWPEFARLISTITAERMHRWLANELGVFTSVETVEIVFTHLKLASFKRPRRGST